MMKPIQEIEAEVKQTRQYNTHLEKSLQLSDDTVNLQDKYIASLLMYVEQLEKEALNGNKRR